MAMGIAARKCGDRRPHDDDDRCFAGSGAVDLGVGIADWHYSWCVIFRW